MPGPNPLADTTDVGLLGVFHLKRLWSRALAARCGGNLHDVAEQQLDQLVIDGLGLGLEQAQQYLLRVAPDFDEFERWIVATTGGVDPLQIARINATVADLPLPAQVRAWLAEIDGMEPVLSAEDLAHWTEHGYVILHDAVQEATRLAAEQAVWIHLGADPARPDSWYVADDRGIMVQLFQNDAFTANRRSSRVHKAFAQLWGTPDLWVSTDRAGFNVPERPGWMFRGPDLHWDVSLARPVPFGTQGILYLTDTPPEQGAFTCVPGFHGRIEVWLDSLPVGTNPREEDLHALGSQPVAGRAGDLIIWDQRLPHGSRPNRGSRPRIVQYVNMYPARREERDTWI